MIDFKKYHGTILATGSEVEIAIIASNELRKDKIFIRVVSFPSWKMFSKKSKVYKNKILGDAYGRDQEFFDFLRTMQACKETFGDTDMSMVIVPGQVCEKFFGEIESDY